MNKDNICDYTISMFQFYAQMKQPDSSEIEKYKEFLSEAAILDLAAVERTLCLLSDTGEYNVLAAVKEIYFSAVGRRLYKSEISRRVIKFSLDNYISERVVWKYLSRASFIIRQTNTVRKICVAVALTMKRQSMERLCTVAKEKDR